MSNLMFRSVWKRVWNLLTKTSAKMWERNVQLSCTVEKPRPCRICFKGSVCLKGELRRLGFLVIKHGLLLPKKKKCSDDKLEIIRLFHGLHVKPKIKSSNPFFGLFVSFLNCVYYLVFYMYHSMVIASNLYFLVNFIS